MFSQLIGTIIITVMNYLEVFNLTYLLLNILYSEPLLNLIIDLKKKYMELYKIKHSWTTC